MERSEALEIARLMGAAGTPDFGEALDRAVQARCAFDMSVLFAFSFDQRPQLLHDGYTSQVSKAALEAYLGGGYLLDPFYVAAIGKHPPGLWRMSDLAPDSFFSSDFMMSPDVHPCISTEAGTLEEEVGFLVPLEEGIVATYSLMRTHAGTVFSDGELEALRAIEPIVSEAIRSDWRFRRPVDYAGRLPASQNDMERAFASLFSETLTQTQREVVKLILRGHSALSIAHRMNISEGTAKNHRANIYKRLNISSQGELFRMFIAHLSEIETVLPAPREE